MIEWLNREIRRRTCVVGTFPDGNSALMLVCTRLRHVAGTPVGQQEIHEHEALGGSSGRHLHCQLTSFIRSLQKILRIILDETRPGIMKVRSANCTNKIPGASCIIKSVDVEN